MFKGKRGVKLSMRSGSGREREGLSRRRKTLLLEAHEGNRVEQTQ